MAVFSVRPIFGPDNEDVKSTIGPSFMEHRLEATRDASLSDGFPLDWHRNTDVKTETEEFDGVTPEFPPCMTVDGTCAPPRLCYLSFYYSAGSIGTLPSGLPSTSRARVFYARMSTGGRAPPKLASPQKESSSVKPKPMPTSSSFMIRSEARKTSDRNSPEGSVRGNSTTSIEITVKKPRGRPRKTIQPQSSPHITSLNHSVSVVQNRGKPRGRPKKISASLSENRMVKPGRMPEETSASKSEDPMKRRRGRPKKISASRSEESWGKPRGMPKEGSVNKSEDTVKRPRGRPRKSLAVTSEVPIKRPVGMRKGSGKKHHVLLEVKAGILSKISREPLVLLSRWCQQKEVLKSVRQASEILASVKKRRSSGHPKKRRSVDRPRKSAGDVASKNREEVDSI